MGRYLALLLIAAVTVAGIGWTLCAGLWLDRPELGTCAVVYPQLVRRPILCAGLFLALWWTMQAGAPALPRWQTLLYLVACAAAGHCCWPHA